MCGRYGAFLPAEAIVALFRIRSSMPNWAPTGNMALTRDAPVVRVHPDSGERRLDLLRWSLLPYWAKEPKSTRQPINARAETLASSAMFRDAFATRRCLVPAEAFYEWQVIASEPPAALELSAAKSRTKPPVIKQPWAIARADGQPLVSR